MNSLNTSKYENKLTLNTSAEAELATEYGDGTRFKVGDVVLHNHKLGTYKRLLEQK